jgi:hypothetical protein
MFKVVGRYRPPVETPHGTKAISRGMRELSWEILPVGWWRDYQQRSEADPVRRRKEYAMRERLELLDKLNLIAWYAGSYMGRRVYYVARFPRVAIADSAEFGNALYYYRCRDESWQDVFKRSKRSALNIGAQRLIHIGEWQERVINLVLG